MEVEAEDLLAVRVVLARVEDVRVPEGVDLLRRNDRLIARDGEEEEALVVPLDAHRFLFGPVVPLSRMYELEADPAEVEAVESGFDFLGGAATLRRIHVVRRLHVARSLSLFTTTSVAFINYRNHFF